MSYIDHAPCIIVLAASVSVVHRFLTLNNLKSQSKPDIHDAKVSKDVVSGALLDIASILSEKCLDTTLLDCDANVALVESILREDVSLLPSLHIYRDKYATFDWVVPFVSLLLRNAIRKVSDLEQPFGPWLCTSAANIAATAAQYKFIEVSEDAISILHAIDACSSLISGDLPDIPSLPSHLRPLSSLSDILNLHRSGSLSWSCVCPVLVYTDRMCQRAVPMQQLAHMLFSSHATSNGDNSPHPDDICGHLASHSNAINVNNGSSGLTDAELAQEIAREIDWIPGHGYFPEDNTSSEAMLHDCGSRTDTSMTLHTAKETTALTTPGADAGEGAESMEDRDAMDSNAVCGSAAVEQYLHSLFQRVYTRSSSSSSSSSTVSSSSSSTHPCSSTSPPPSAISATPTFTYSELFAGVGGFGQALHSLGGHCVAAVEIEQHARKVYTQNSGSEVFPAFSRPVGEITRVAEEHATFYSQLHANKSSETASFSSSSISSPSGSPSACSSSSSAPSPCSSSTTSTTPLSPPRTMLFSDVTLVQPHQFPTHDILTAGFPCQPFSRLGNQPGLDDARKGQLILHVLRLARAANVKVMFLENVPGLVSLQSGMTLCLILRAISRAGYAVAYHIIDAKAVVPQYRRRIYIVAVRKDIISELVKNPESTFHFPELPPLNRPVCGILQPDSTIAPSHMLSKAKWTHIQENVIGKKGNWKVCRPFDFAGTLVTSYRRGYNYNSQFVPVYPTGTIMSAGVVGVDAVDACKGSGANDGDCASASADAIADVGARTAAGSYNIDADDYLPPPIDDSVSCWPEKLQFPEIHPFSKKWSRILSSADIAGAVANVVSCARRKPWYTYQAQLGSTVVDNLSSSSSLEQDIDAEETDMWDQHATPITNDATTSKYGTIQSSANDEGASTAAAMNDSSVGDSQRSNDGSHHTAAAAAGSSAVVSQAVAVCELPPRVRYYTERECARIMGFPESFILPGEDASASTRVASTISSALQLRAESDANVDIGVIETDTAATAAARSKKRVSSDIKPSIGDAGAESRKRARGSVRTVVPGTNVSSSTASAATGTASASAAAVSEGAVAVVCPSHARVRTRTALFKHSCDAAPAHDAGENARAYAMMGNAVCPPVIAGIAHQILTFSGILPSFRVQEVSSSSSSSASQHSTTSSPSFLHRTTSGPRFSPAAEAAIALVLRACSEKEKEVLWKRMQWLLTQRK